jgi:hypothetical protein
MLRLILIAIVGLFVLVGGLAVALYHFWGWKGMIAFPFVVLAFVWLVKILITNLIKRFALGLFGMKSRALRGATMNVHSIKSISKPPEPEAEADDDKGGADVEEDKPGEATKMTSSEPPKDYMEMDVTITPKPNSCNSIWEPSELILTSEKIKSLTDVEEKEIGTVHSLQVWNGTAFGPDDPGKYPGEQRLKIIFAAKPAANHAWLHYYNEPIGELKLPVGTVDV